MDNLILITHPLKAVAWGRQALLSKQQRSKIGGKRRNVERSRAARQQSRKCPDLNHDHNPNPISSNLPGCEAPLYDSLRLLYVVLTNNLPGYLRLCRFGGKRREEPSRAARQVLTTMPGDRGTGPQARRQAIKAKFVHQFAAH